jgi:glycosidase
MQWTSGKNDGFSTADPEKLYLPVDTAADAPNVADQEKDPNSLLNRVKKLIALRKREKALAAYAEFVPVYAKENTYPFIYARANGDSKLLVLLNPAARDTEAAFSIQPGIKHMKLIAGTELKFQQTGEKVQVAMPGQTYAIYTIQ